MPKTVKENLHNPSSINRLLNRYMRIIQLVLLIVLLLLGYLFLINPTLSKINEQKSILLSSKLETISAMDDYLAKLKTLKKAQDDFTELNQAELDKLNEILPAEQDKAGLIAQIVSLIEASGFVMNNISINEGLPANFAEASDSTETIKPEEVTEENLEEFEAQSASNQNLLRVVNITISVKGKGYEDFKKLLENIESHIRLFDINSVAFSEPESPDSSYNITLNTYYYLEKK